MRVRTRNYTVVLEIQVTHFESQLLKCGNSKRPKLCYAGVLDLHTIVAFFQSFVNAYCEWEKKGFQKVRIVMVRSLKWYIGIR